MADQFERFTAGAREAIALAVDEASRLRRNGVDTEHLLLGVLGVEDTAVEMLSILGFDPDLLRRQTLEVSSRLAPAAGDGQLSAQSTSALEFAAEEATTWLGDEHVGTEHLLMGLLRVRRGLAARVLKDAGVTGGPLREAARAMPGRDRR